MCLMIDKEIKYYNQINFWDDIYKKNNMLWGMENSKASDLALNYICLNKSENIIDLGCGYGRDIIFFKKKYEDINIDGIDISEHAIFLYNKNFSFERRITVFNLNVLNLHKIDKKYSVVFSNHLFHFFSYVEIVHILKSIKKILINDGIFIGSFLVENEIFADEIYSKIIKSTFGAFGKMNKRFFSEEVLKEIITQSKMTLVDLVPYFEYENINGYSVKSKSYLIMAKNNN